MDKIKVLYRATRESYRTINPDVKHTRGGEVLPIPARLDIAQYNEDSGIYVFRYDAEGNEITDTWHEDISSAMDQCEFEFGLFPADWEQVWSD